MVKKVDGASSFPGAGALPDAGGADRAAAGGRPSATARPRSGQLSGLSPRRTASGEGGTKSGVLVKPKFKVVDLQARSRNQARANAGGEPAAARPASAPATRHADGSKHPSATASTPSMFGDGSSKSGFSVKPRLKIAAFDARSRNPAGRGVDGEGKASHGVTQPIGREAGHAPAPTHTPASQAPGGGTDALHDAARQVGRETDDTIAMMQKLADESAKSTLATALEKHKTDLANALAEIIKSTGSNIRNAAQG